jgi:hypothetical protein
MRIEGLEHIVYHPEDGLATLGLTEVIAPGCAVHLFDGQFAGSNERLKEVEVINATGFNHRHRGQYEIYLTSDVRGLRLEGLEGVTEYFVPLHRHKYGLNFFNGWRAFRLSPYIYT